MLSVPTRFSPLSLERLELAPYIALLDCCVALHVLSFPGLRGCEIQHHAHRDSLMIFAHSARGLRPERN